MNRPGDASPGRGTTIKVDKTEIDRISARAERVPASAVADAERLLEILVDEGPATSGHLCERLGWTRARFGTALSTARRDVGPKIGIAVPHPTPGGGWRYQAATEWEPIEVGAAFSMRQVETRLLNVHRDVRVIKPQLDQGTTAWRRANFLDKHLDHILSVLKEIGS